MEGLATKVIRKNYSSNFAFVRVRGIVPNPENARQFPFEAECLIDTGFYGGVYLPDSFLSDAKTIGVTPTPTNITLADGSEIVAHVCAAYLLQIEDHKFNWPGKPIFLVIYGNKSDELIGMNSLKHFPVLFDGPNSCFTISL